MAVELTLSPETIRMLVQKARSAAAALNDAFEEDRGNGIDFDEDHLSDLHMHDGLAEEESIDLSEEELRELISDLNVDESAELVAIAWVGRGDFDASDFDQAVEEARARGMKGAASYLIGLPLLADYLENGLETLGF
ncbi:DUF3775 domain-containing protein [Pannonibacter sp. Q-1]|uniref:Uncharacterized protein n=1 Tax=Pannonibacter phragmitetus TaxID=121719 RepID=A0A0L0IU70_9HYPH|nr:DUF3775 domain-containing protein [Pannonibacter phragmitetus]ALV27994.1 hypothetical protein APZ00_13720 [Pannonibacter phragmitetus]KND16779.1 hypothetical protein ADZ37_21365 [Pannonibacter phragmitetus]MBA4203858.1 DUF3775 domain-containing protein [Polymorphum sp.]